MVKAAVVILNYNGKHFLERYLPGIISHSSPHEVIVADNHSSDGSVEYLRAAFPQLRVITNKGNYGYAQGYNLALAQVDADIAVLLNNDLEVEAGWLEPLLQIMKDPSVGACQPLILDHANREMFEYAGAAGGFIDYLGYPFCRGRIFNTLERNEGQYPTGEIFWASGAAMCVNLRAFQEAGGFDASYFAHMEEIDLCWRMKNLGYRIIGCSASRIYHIGGGTLSKISPRKTLLNFRNNLSTLLKNHAAPGLFYKLPARLVLDGVAGLKFLIEGQPAHCFAVLRAHFGFYARVPDLLRQRKAMQKKQGFRFSLAQVYAGSIVTEYHLSGRRTFSRLRRRFFSE